MRSLPGSTFSAASRWGRRFAGRRRVLGALASALMVTSLTVVLPPAARAASTAPSCTGNAVVCENQLPGTPASVWDVNGSGDPDIQGFATQISVNVGQTVQFKIDTSAAAYRIEIYRLGYYQGNGARKQADVTPSASLPQIQPACATDATTEIYDCGTWGVSASWAVPSTAVSGVYIARLIRTDNGDSSHIPFIVRDDSSHSQIVYQTSDPTWQAYNTYGQSDFYQGLANGRAYKVSYNRPFTTRGQNDGRDFLFSNEYPMIRYLEQNGYDVSYISGLDTDVRGSLLTNHKVFMDVGHDEYWSDGQRTSVAAARDAGVSLAFFSGNEVYWKTRWEASEDGTATANRTLVCYKDTWANQQIDPLGPTATWRDPRWGGNGKGPENGLTGTMYMSNFTDLAITVSAAEGAARLWRNTSLSSQAAGTSTALFPHSIGYESDEDVDNGYRPAGLVDLSTTTGPTPQYLTDFGNTVVPGTTTHHVTLYRAPSGALVFAAGTIQWAWGVDSNHDGTPGPADQRIRQATMNLLADMGATATTVASDLVPATRSTDTTPPVATITSPAANSASQQGSLVTVTGTATDSGGGIVAGVEVSVDAGSTWHPASISGTGTKAFTYTGVLTGTGAQAIQARATDDSGNTQTPAAAVPLQVSCPCSMFGAVTPGTPAVNDASAVTLGVKFTSSAAGFITGIRFYKGVGNSGTHVGTLYDASGNVLASVTFSGESPTGWQTANFTSVVPISAGATYVAAYTAPAGNYAADNYYFIRSGHTAGTLTALGGTTDQNNGVYAQGSGFPTTSYQNTNYYVDVVYSATDNTPLSAAANTPLPGSSSVPTSTTATATFSRAITPSSINMTIDDPSNVVVPGAIAYDSTTRKVTFNPTHSLEPSTAYTVRLTATSPDVGAMAAPLVWSFTTAAPPAVPGVCPCSLFADSSAPTTGPTLDSPVQLGTAFTSDLNGSITAIRFYKDPRNTGVHTVSLYTAAGTLLGTATTGTESTSGWQTATFATPIAITKATMYIASYLTTTGYYSYTAAGLATAVDAIPLHAPATGGRYAYSGAPTNPSSSNYFVDPVFVPAPDAAPVVVAVDPADNSTSVPVSATVTATFAGAVQASSIAMSVVADDGTVVPGSIANESLGTTATFVATAGFAPSTHYTVTVSSATSAGGTAMTTPVVTHFTTSGAAACPCSVFASGALPAVSDSADAGPITVGTKFTPSINGSITGIRYYRDAANTGTHTGTLYGADGTRLTTVTFPGSATAGWQSATFAAPVAVTAGTTYVAAAYMPVGHYSASSGFFAAPYVNSPLTGTAGVYTYGSDTFPTSSYNNTNYWVDVAFNTTAVVTPSLTVSGQTPAAGATGVSTSVSPSATFSAPIDPTTLQMSITGPGGLAVSGSASYNAATNTATFNPTNALSNSATYSVSLSGIGTAGGSMASPATWSFSTVAPPAPTVSGLSPAAGTTGVSPTVTPTATFNAQIDVSTLQFTLTGPGGATVGGIDSYDQSTRIATFTPTSPLAYNTAYTASLTASSLQGAPMAAPSTWTFTTVAPSAPTVSGQTPAAGATAVDPGATVSATFSAAIVQSSLAFTLTGPGGVAVPGTTSYNSTTNTATFQPSAALANSTGYTASLSATGVNGGLMAAPVTWSFSTVAQVAPSVSGQTPAAGATSIALTTAVTGTFSIPITQSTLAFTLTSSTGTAVAGTVSYAAGTGLATFQPTASLGYGVTYTASLKATATSGVAMAAPVTWSFTTVAAPVATVSGQSPAAGSTGAAVTASATGTFSIPITTSTLQFTLTGPGGAVAGTTSYNATTRVATFKPTASLAYGTTYTASLSATSSLGGLMAAPSTWSFTTIPAAVPTVSGLSPASGATGVALTASQVGTFSIAITTSTLKFTLTGPGGAVTGTTSYNATTRVATFKPTASLAYGTLYTASLSATGSTGGVMAAPATWSFTTVAAPAPAVSGLSPAAGSTAVTSGSVVTGTFSIPITPSTVQFTLTAAGVPVAGVTTYNATTRVATFDPTAALPFGTVFTASLSGVSTLGGVMAAPATWSFTTVPAVTLNSLWGPTDTPATVSNGTSSQTTLGVSFYSDKAGSVTAVKFYAGPSNTGSHPVAIYSSGGTLLGSGTLTPTVVGWNTAPLNTPVPITAGTTYVATYTAPVGRFSSTSFGYLVARNNGIMHARFNAGLSRTGTGFPTAASTTNYWVDPVVSVPGA